MDISKHSMIFEPSKVAGRIAIAGLGSIGSAVALNLAKLGLADKLVLFDHDIVEGHNISNQVLYGVYDIGNLKVEAAAMSLHQLVGNMPMIASGKLENKNQLPEDTTHLFVCVDSMSARAEIFDTCVFFNPMLKYFADGRMAAKHGMCYGFDPSNLPKAKEYKKRLYPDSDVPTEQIGGCSITPSIGATAMFIATQMTWQFINHTNGQLPYEEIAFQVDNLEVHTKGYL